MILLTFQHFDPFTHWLSTLAGRWHGSGCAWLRCNWLEWINHSPRPAMIDVRELATGRHPLQIAKPQRADDDEPAEPTILTFWR